MLPHEAAGSSLPGWVCRLSRVLPSLPTNLPIGQGPGFAAVTLPVACLAAVLVVALTGCHAAPTGPDLGSLYNRAASSRDEWRNPIVVIPGILGSRLVDDTDGTVVWGAFSGGFANPETADGARRVALPMTGPAELKDRMDRVRSDGVLDTLQVDVLGLPVRLDAYRQILGTLGLGGYRDESLALAGAIDYGDDHFTCFQFAYDWRLGIDENGARLTTFLEAKREEVRLEWERRYGPRSQPVRFDIVAHSMGGLVARWMLRYGDQDVPADGFVPWAGADLVDRVVLVGTPNAGSLKSLMQMTGGLSFGAFTPDYAPAVIGTWPSVYQLLPRARHDTLLEVDADGSSHAVDDLLDSGLWDQRAWGLADPDQDEVLEMLLPGIKDPAQRRLVARRHLEQCLAAAQRVQAALDVRAEPPAGTSLSLVAGDGQLTDAVASVANGRHLPHVSGLAPGDGTVTRASALMDERLGAEWQRELLSPIRWSSVLFVFRDHLGLTQDPAFADNLLYQLLEAPRSR